jgi:hypothetical protein
MSRTVRLVTVGVLGLAVVVVFGVLVWLVLSGSIFFAPVPGAVPASEGLTPLSGRQAFDDAQQVAQAWQPDAVPIRVAADWDAARLDDLTLGAPDWVVTFYSPTAGEQLRVVVSAASARALAPIRPVNLPQTVDLGRWQVDSQQALSLFLKDGAEAFIADHQPVRVFLILSPSGSGRLQWTIAALDPSGSESYPVVIDATTGSIIE